MDKIKTMQTFQNLTQTFTPTIFSWGYFSDFEKIKKNTFKIKIQLNILNALLGEKNIEQKFLEIIKNYPEIRKVLPILIAVRQEPHLILDIEKEEIYDVSYLFDKNAYIVEDWEENLLDFFRKSWLKNIFENKKISNLNDYVFWIETWLDSNARKNRTWKLMENIVEKFVKKLCEEKWFEYKEQATAKFIQENWWIEVKSDKSSRRFDFAIYNPSKNKIYLLEVNYYSWGWSKLKAVAWEFAWLYEFMKSQNIDFYWITDWIWWNAALKSLEEAYDKMDWDIYNIEMLKSGILFELIK